MKLMFFRPGRVSLAWALCASEDTAVTCVSPRRIGAMKLMFISVPAASLQRGLCAAAEDTAVTSLAVANRSDEDDVYFRPRRVSRVGFVRQRQRYA